MNDGISVDTRITDWGWEERTRPELVLYQDGKSGHIEVGGITIELSGSNNADFKSVLKGWRDIFSKGVDLS